MTQKWHLLRNPNLLPIVPPQEPNQLTLAANTSTQPTTLAVQPPMTPLNPDVHKTCRRWIAWSWSNQTSNKTGSESSASQVADQALQILSTKTEPSQWSTLQLLRTTAKNYCLRFSRSWRRSMKTDWTKAPHVTLKILSPVSTTKAVKTLLSSWYLKTQLLKRVFNLATQPVRITTLRTQSCSSNSFVLRTGWCVRCLSTTTSLRLRPMSGICFGHQVQSSPISMKVSTNFKKSISSLNHTKSHAKTVYASTWSVCKKSSENQLSTLPQTRTSYRKNSVISITTIRSWSNTSLRRTCGSSSQPTHAKAKVSTSLTTSMMWMWTRHLWFRSTSRTPYWLMVTNLIWEST